MKHGKLWTMDGTFYTEDTNIILQLIDYKQGKKDYTITDDNGNIIALAQIID